MRLLQFDFNRGLRTVCRHLAVLVALTLVLNPLEFSLSSARAQDNNPLYVNGKYYTNVKPIAEGISLDQAKSITAENGVDEIIFEGQDGKLYIAYGEKGAMSGLGEVRDGYLGSYGGSKVKVVSVNDENNTFVQGAVAVPKSVGSTLTKVFRDNFGTTITTILSTISGGVIAALALKSGVSAGAAAAASTGAAGGAGVATAVTGATAALKAALLGMVQPVIIGVVGITAVVAVVMAINGVRSAFRKPKFATIDMVTDQKFEGHVPEDTNVTDRIRAPKEGTESKIDEPMKIDGQKILLDPDTDM